MWMMKEEIKMPLDKESAHIDNLCMQPMHHKLETVWGVELIM